jgi:predicted 3-demethylubiquinone-9 3-methyltransferase (glyoxalase superfamily)
MEVKRGEEEEQVCGWRGDRCGFSSQMTPRALNNAMATPDRVEAKRAMGKNADTEY